MKTESFLSKYVKKSCLSLHSLLLRVLIYSKKYLFIASYGKISVHCITVKQKTKLAELLISSIKKWGVFLVPSSTPPHMPSFI